MLLGYACSVTGVGSYWLTNDEWRIFSMVNGQTIIGLVNCGVLEDKFIYLKKAYKVKNCQGDDHIPNSLIGCSVTACGDDFMITTEHIVTSCVWSGINPKSEVEVC